MSEHCFATEGTSCCHFAKTEPFQGWDIELRIVLKPADVMYQIQLYCMVSDFHLKVRPIF